jgi:hypothetical protein
MSDISLTVYNNEDLYRDFQLKEGTTANDAIPTDLTGYQLACELRDDKDVLILRMDSDDATTLIITDAPNGKFGFRIDRALFAPLSKNLKFDILLTDNTGFTRNLLNGQIKIKTGVTRDI